MSRYVAEGMRFEIFSRGVLVIHWEASVPYSWVRLSSTSGELSPGEDDARIWVSIEWELVPEIFAEEILIDVRSIEDDFEQIHLPISGQRAPETFKGGFVEGDEFMCIPASQKTNLECLSKIGSIISMTLLVPPL